MGCGTSKKTDAVEPRRSVAKTRVDANSKNGDVSRTGTPKPGSAGSNRRHEERPTRRSGRASTSTENSEDRGITDPDESSRSDETVDNEEVTPLEVVIPTDVKVAPPDETKGKTGTEDQPESNGSDVGEAENQDESAVKGQDESSPLDEENVQNGSATSDEGKDQNESTPTDEVKGEGESTPVDEVKDQDESTPTDEVKDEGVSTPSDEVKNQDESTPAGEVKDEDASTPADEVKSQGESIPSDETKDQQDSSTPSEEVNDRNVSDDSEGLAAVAPLGAATDPSESGTSREDESAPSDEADDRQNSGSPSGKAKDRNENDDSEGLVAAVPLGAEIDRTESRTSGEVKDEDESETELPPLSPPLRTQRRLVPDVTVFAELDDYVKNAPDTAAGSVQSLSAYLTSRCSNDVEKVRALFCWLAYNIEYDTASYFSKQSEPQDNGSVLQSGKAVCRGYSDLFLALCKQAQIPCLAVNGLAKGYSHDPEDVYTDTSKVNHSWNLVHVQGEWHPLDVTWGAGHTDKERNFHKTFKENWFLADPEVFILRHFPVIDGDAEESAKYQLLKTPISLETFSAGIRPESLAHEIGLKYLTHDRTVIDVTGDVTIRLKATRLPLQALSVSLTERGSEEATKDRCNTLASLDEDGACTVYVRPPRAATYLLDVMGQVVGQDVTELHQLVTYVIRCKSTHPDLAPFPYKVGAWGLQNPTATECGLLTAPDMGTAVTNDVTSTAGTEQAPTSDDVTNTASSEQAPTSDDVTNTASSEQAPTSDDVTNTASSEQAPTSDDVTNTASSEQASTSDDVTNTATSEQAPTSDDVTNTEQRPASSDVTNTTSSEQAPTSDDITNTASTEQTPASSDVTNTEQTPDAERQIPVSSDLNDLVGDDDEDDDDVDPTPLFADIPFPGFKAKDGEVAVPVFFNGFVPLRTQLRHAGDMSEDLAHFTFLRYGPPGRATVSVRLAKSGYYMLRLFASHPEKSGYHHVADCLLFADRDQDGASRCQAFPQAFKLAYEQQARLLRPLVRRVPSGEATLFRVRAPALSKVSVGEKRMEMTRREGVWEAEVTPEEGKNDVTIFAAAEKGSTSMRGMFKFACGPSQSR